MNNQREIYEALLAGETLIYRTHPFDRIIKMENGNITDINGGDVSLISFSVPYVWSIYKEPKWYENIPEGGVLCWCKDGETDKPTVASIVEQGKSNGYYTAACKHWIYAEPLTKQEIRVFRDNAPEAK